MFPTAWGRLEAVTETPIGVPCPACKVPIQDGDVGLVMPHMDLTGTTEQPWHRTCFLDALGIDVKHAR